jgi:HEAT repeat protein
LLTDESWQVHLKAIRSLGLLKAVKAIDQIAPALDHEISNLRKEAAAAFGEIANAAALPYLEKLVDDPDPDVRKNVRWALVKIKS